MRISVFFTLLFLLACTDKAPQSSSISLPNPASKYCVDVMGGRSEIKTEKDGQVGYCHWPDGSVVDEWTLFREHAAPDESN